MASTNKTPHGLNQWVGADIPAMDDFNSDNSIMDGQLSDLQTDIALTKNQLAAVQGRFTDNSANHALMADQAYAAANGIGNRMFSIGLEAWGESYDFISYPYETRIACDGLTAENDVIVMFDVASVLAAREAGIADGIAKTVANGIIIYAEKRPTQELAGTYSLIHREG